MRQRHNHASGKPPRGASVFGAGQEDAGECWREYWVPALDYDLKTTLTSGQAFRWNETSLGWEGVVDRTWVRLNQEKADIRILTREKEEGVSRLRHYLQLDEDWHGVLNSFPADRFLQKAVQACRGLRLLRQDPWECLASFLLSSTKQIVQIRQIVSTLCTRFGDPVSVPPSVEVAFSFPSAFRIAGLSEAELRACKMGFRAKYLLETARLVESGSFDLAEMGSLPLPQARERFTSLPGVGPKIADCVLLFAYGFQRAFPIDVWVRRGLEGIYFGKRKMSLDELRRFSETHFGARGGYAQQYLFHWLRTNSRDQRFRASQRKTISTD